MTGLEGERPAKLWALIIADIRENSGAKAQPVHGVASLLVSRGVQVTALYRLGHASHWVGLGLVGSVLQRLAQVLYGADIDYRATIGPGLVLRHPVGVVVGRDVVIGARVRLFQNVTLGNRMSGSAERPDGMPRLEDDVHVYAGAVVLGPITVGAGSVIGANAVLTRSCSPGSRVVAPSSTVTPPSAS